MARCAVAGWIAGALEGAVVMGRLSALGAGLCSIGIRKNCAREGYCTRAKHRQYEGSVSR
jgi:hypothetical protein